MFRRIWPFQQNLQLCLCLQHPSDLTSQLEAEVSSAIRTRGFNVGVAVLGPDDVHRLDSDTKWYSTEIMTYTNVLLNRLAATRS